MSRCRRAGRRNCITDVATTWTVNWLRYGRVIDLDGRRQRVELEDRVYTILRDTREIVDILNGRD